MTDDHAAPLSDLVTVVVATRDRADQLEVTLRHLVDVDDHERPAVVVVDNASSDDTVARTRELHPAVQVVALDRNEGAAARNIGAATAATEVVAFSDDDSWWAPGSLRRAAQLFREHPRQGLVAARVLVGPENRVDPVSDVMARSPLAPPPDARAPGTPILGFLACAAVVRRSAFLDAGGFSRTLFFLGEEQVLAIDLAAAGWDLSYVHELVAHHHPTPSGRVAASRTVRQRRNHLLSTWMRRPLRRAVAATADLARDGLSQPEARNALVEAVRLAPAAWRERRIAPPAVEARLSQLERWEQGTAPLLAAASRRTATAPAAAPVGAAAPSWTTAAATRP